MSTLIKIICHGYNEDDKPGTPELTHDCWKKYPEYMYRYPIAMERLKMAIPWNASSIWNEDPIWLDRSDLLCHKVLLKYKRDRESCWHRLQMGTVRVPPAGL